MRAVVFDMDGVIVDSEAQWKALEAEFFRAAVPAWREEHHHKIVGMGVEDVFEFLVREFRLTMGKVIRVRMYTAGKVMFMAIVGAETDDEALVKSPEADRFLNSFALLGA